MLALSTLPAPWNVVSELLFLLIAALLIGGFTRYPYDKSNLGRMPVRTRLPQSVVLIVVTLIFWLSAARTTPLAILGLLTLLGMTFGFLGDLFMADVFSQKDHVLFGIVAFAIGHGLYMAGFREIAVTLSLHMLDRYLIAVLALWVVALVIWFMVARNPEGEAAMQVATLLYTLFLASMAGYATGLALHDVAFWPLAVGAILFLFSDALIAARLFGGLKFHYMSDVIWATYITAQALIVTAVPVAISLL